MTVRHPARARRSLIGRAALGLIFMLVVCVPLARAAVPPVPDKDPFYAVPDGIADLPNGTVLDSRQITAYSGLLKMPATAWQVKYKTLDSQGRPTATVTTVLVPNSPWTGKGPRPLVSYQVAEDGVGSKCSASYGLSAGLQLGSQAVTGNAALETVLMRLALQRGWAVAAPDYEGPRSEFLGADMEARGVLDGIRAAIGFQPAGVSDEAPIAMWGYSGGALASTLAAQLQPSYAPDVKLAGIVLGGAVGDLKSSLAAFDKLGLGGASVIGLIGLSRAHPDLHLEQYLNAAGQRAIVASQSDCLADALLRYPGRTSASFSLPGFLDGPVLTKLLRESSPLGRPGTPSAPVYDYHAGQDELAPIGPDRELMARYCADGVAVQHVEFPGEHLSEVAVGAPGALAYIADRFAGLPAPSNCSG
ncbi:MAG TPA: lipase family protein [Solirubrobacterales bacterium]|jgi:acetyl esterase/lipase